ncbi:hypothetical protein E1287_07895 [Actinomadura sp. KC06]|uniref:SCO2583/SCO2584 N-terminal domain-containing protein n=1 Tax=Actinomadura sp. KC06 TaxID=2530369 RepID=UPI001045FC22|nr:hypothetical protein [Actinomadura sp. KC06]TDD37692.1 hypothetical protein E1287_07895 [Actinomadura sp. KC06]
MAADFDEPVFDENFVRSATFTEPSASERARAPGKRERRRDRRAARRAARSGGLRFRRRRRRDPSHRMAVVQVLAGILVLFAISFALWWWNSGSRNTEEPVQPVVPTVTNSPAPAPTTAAPTTIPEV